ncbi:MAG: ketoacyl-ACP synthase III [Alphaproteobacteria bacterium]|nr:ketoacyl-ACP synthase III [Alphaproteobacteria bacterium]
MRSVITGCGAYLPDQIVTNADLAKKVDTNDEWIVQRTGIRQRHIAAAGQTTSDMAIEAARAALKAAGLTGADIGGVIVATSTPDTTFPAVAARVQAELGIPPGPAMDVQAVCSGFVYGLTVADSLIRTGLAKRFLLIGAEKMSSILDWNDRTTCVLFGDGAGAVILEAQEGAGTVQDRGVLSTHLYADGRLRDILYTSGGVSSTGDAGFIRMEGKEVFRNAVQLMADIVGEVLERNKITPADIDFLVPHQANIRIIEATAKKLDMDMDRVVVTVDRHGNTSAASIPLALCAAIEGGKIKKGDLLLLEALGAGLTWGAALVRF